MTVSAPTAPVREPWPEFPGLPFFFNGNDPLVQSWWRFHRKNPHVYTRLKVLALRTKAKGLEHYGIAALFEVMRYESLTTAGEPWKMNNSYRALYARLLEYEVPQLNGFFRMSRLRDKRRVRMTEHPEVRLRQEAAESHLFWPSKPEQKGSLCTPAHPAVVNEEEAA